MAQSPQVKPKENGVLQDRSVQMRIDFVVSRATDQTASLLIMCTDHSARRNTHQQPPQLSPIKTLH